MSFPTLKRGDQGEDVIRLQSQLNKTGAMLIVDGDFGPGTEKGVLYSQDIAGQSISGIVKPDLWEWLEQQPHPSQRLDTDGIAFIAKEETGGLAYYDLITRWPHYPGHASGVTVGTGYDLRFNTELDFKSTWGQFLPPEHINELVKDIGKKGSKARTNELKAKNISIPFKHAWPVFIEHTLPRYYDYTQSIYPSLSSLPSSCRSVLVSLVFNRGTKLSGDSRKEMKNIQSLLISADDQSLSQEEIRKILHRIEDEILAMKRLWAPGSGLIKRRQAEANLWRQGLSQ